LIFGIFLKVNVPKIASNGHVFEEKAILSDFRHLWVTLMKNPKLKKSRGLQKLISFSFFDSLDALDQKSIARRNSRTKIGFS